MKKINLIISIIILFSITFCLGGEFSTEFEEAYNWAYKNGITTQPNIDSANMKGNITREEMAKMISNYVKNILGKTPDTTKPCFFLNSNINPDLVQSVTESCQLGLMGQGINDFRPKDSVTRAEFGTILSRALRGNKNEGGTNYYENHLKALKSEGIMNNMDTPMDNEIRGFVMLMLLRSSNPIQSYNDEDYYEYDYVPGKEDNQIAHVIGILD